LWKVDDARFIHKSSIKPWFGTAIIQKSVDALVYRQYSLSDALLAIFLDEDSSIIIRSFSMRLIEIGWIEPRGWLVSPQNTDRKVYGLNPQKKLAACIEMNHGKIKGAKHLTELSQFTITYSQIFHW
jgi:hypothetical protein